MCLPCAIKHKREMPDHFMQSLYSPKQIQNLMKGKEETFNKIVHEELASLIEKRVQDDLIQFQESLYEECE